LRIPTTLDLDLEDLGVLLKEHQQLLQELLVYSAERVTPGRELKLNPDLQKLRPNLRLDVLGATLLFYRPRLTGTAIDLIQEAIFIIVRIRAAILIQKAIQILLLQEAVIFKIRHPISIIVQIGATISILEMVVILRFVGTEIEIFRETIRVSITYIGATIFIKTTIARLGEIWTEVTLIRNPILIIVRIGAAILISEAISILWTPGAVILKIQDGIFIQISRDLLPVKAQEALQERLLSPERSAEAQEQNRPRREKEPQAQSSL